MGKPGTERGVAKCKKRGKNVRAEKSHREPGRLQPASRRKRALQCQQTESSASERPLNGEWSVFKRFALSSAEV